MSVELAACRETQVTRRHATLLVLAWTAFIVYGSLFPFDFRSTGEPWQAIFAEWNPLQKRADALDNVLLFVPLGAALYFACHSVRARVVAVLTCWATLGVGMQLLQLYLPSRVGSVADAINNAAGMLIGLLVARAVSPWLQQKRLAGRIDDPLALLLVGAWIVYESFPFLPTLDVGLLAAHIKPALIPPEFEVLRWFRHALAAVIGTMLLLSAQPLRSRMATIVVVLAVLLAAEVLVAYGDLRLEAVAGIVSGMVFGVWLDHRMVAGRHWAVLVAGATALTMTVVTDFRGPLEASVFTLTPFSRLLWHGTTVEIPTAAFEALAIGALMWAGVSGGTPLAGRPWLWPALVVVVVAALEAIRVGLGRGPAGTTMMAMAVLLSPFAAAIRRRQIVRLNRSYSGMARLNNVIGPQSDVGASSPQTSVAGASPSPIRSPGGARATPGGLLARHANVGWALAALFALTIGLRLLLELPAIPYNVLELFQTRSLVHVGLFAAALLWLGAGPWWASRAAAGRRAAPLWLPVFLVLAALTSLLLLRFSVTQESLDDITGSTDLYRRVAIENYWGAEWRDRIAGLPATAVAAIERGVRYTALYSLLLVPLTAAAICIDKAWPMRRALPALAVLGMCLGLAKWVVVDGAVTDNLTELIAPDGLPWLAMLAIGFSLHVAWASGRWSFRRGLVFGIVTLAVLPLSWWLLKHGLEQVIVKYGAVWSAEQFLLGSNHLARLTEGQLFIRWSIVYLAMLGVASFGMALARRCGPLPAARPRPG